MMLVTSSPHQSAQTLLSHSTSVDSSAVILKMANSIEDMSLSGDSGLSVAVVSSGAVGLQHKTPATSENDFHSTTRGRDRMSFGEQVLPMRAPHISTLYDKQDVMTKHFGVTQEQALRTQALLRLGVTDEDVRIAERLMGPRSAGDNTHSKAEWLLGYTHAQMSYHKALEVLGVSEAVVEEERARRLGELGLASWGTSRTRSDGGFGQEGDDLCGGFFAKRRRSASHDSASLGTTLPGEARVLQLEEVCHTQLNRIQQLESQLAALTAKSPSPSDQ